VKPTAKLSVPAGDEQRDFLVVTTEPGWAFATLRELRDRGIRSYIPFFHRDSTLIITLGAGEARLLLTERLATPASVFGGILVADGAVGRDATVGLKSRLGGRILRSRIARWRGEPERGPQLYCLVSEVYGHTRVFRHALAQTVRRAVEEAFPRWREVPRGGRLFLAKADREFGAIGTQLYTNLARETTGRPGELRRHLAAALLTLARVQQNDPVLDPFMGTGTVLRVACEQMRAARCIGIEVDPEAYGIAARALSRHDVRLRMTSFDDIEPSLLPDHVKVVSNLPFGHRFVQVPLDRLLKFFVLIQPRVRAFALLLGRQQAAEVARRLDLTVKNVLVLGQPAAIAYSPSGSTPRSVEGA